VSDAALDRMQLRAATGRRASSLNSRSSVRRSQCSMEKVGGTGIFPTVHGLSLSSLPFNRLFIASLLPRTGKERIITITNANHHQSPRPPTQRKRCVSACV
jgi:hypothetical protein